MEAINRALANSLILQKIFLQSEFTLRKEFRVVNQLWRNSSVEKWRKCVVVQINIADQQKEGTSTSETIKHSLEEFLSLCEGGENEAYRISEFPFQRLRICGGNTIRTTSVINIEDEDNPVQKIIRGGCFHCPSMTYLELNGLHCTKNLMKTFKWILSEGCVNLKELNIANCFINYHKDEKNATKPTERNAPTITAKQLKIITVQNTRWFVYDRRQESVSVTWDIPASEILELVDTAPNLKAVFYDLIDAKKVRAMMPEAKRTAVEFIELRHRKSYKNIN